ncbi:GNAT family N-acetyltransferase [Crenobacter sp. SG2305]|uniref:GNAT family N-acetyltransferase n=1 Tax=Crenobacter oryzisoli TaxID=3056844 RepID=UPI0025AB50AA|nr:GNAT family N-acetyltransferase [Crenobacter sp. SG2305]MDN0081313.1 GNAT family N-acetyltransferase [Crenobacter sp. SG2305]
MASQLQWQCYRFDGFTPLGLYQVLQLRDQVFVVEQRSIYGDIDGTDLDCWHLCGRDGDGELAAYARLIAPDEKYPGAVAIGRVVVAPALRGHGLGRQLMAEAIAQCARLWPGAPMALSAQIAAQELYRQFGFETEGEPYDDGGILHIDMRRPAAAA